MNLQELLDKEYEAILSLDFDYTDSIDSYKKQTSSCSKNKINQNSIELYQANQKLYEMVNASFISLDEEEKNEYYELYEKNINQSYIFKNLKNKIFNIPKSKDNSYVNQTVEKYKLLLLKSIEENNINKANILYFSIRLLRNNFESSEKIINYFISIKSNSDL